MRSLTQTQLHRLGTMQRRMLRNMIRWMHVDSEDWHDTMSRMESRMARGSLQFFVTPWEFQFHKAQWSYAIHASRCSNTSWINSVSRWDPPRVVDDSLPQVPKRNAGRPRVRWDDRIAAFTALHIDSQHH